MKTIIAGSRTITDYKLLEKLIAAINFEITEVVCGMAKGVDTLGQTYARLNNIKISYFRPRWELYGKSAGFKRNKEMANYAEAAIIVWDGFSNGSKNMIELSIKKGLTTVVYNQALYTIDRYPAKIK